MRSASILLKSFVKPFYRENASLFLFLVTVMFCIVNKVDGAGIFEYHTVLITAMLTNPLFLVFVFFCWLLYARKCHGFITRLLDAPDYVFCSVLNRLSPGSRFGLFFGMQLLMFLPLLLYAGFIFYTASQLHAYIQIVMIAAYLITLPAIAANWQVQQLDHQQVKTWPLAEKIAGIRLLPVTYTRLLWRYLAGRQKIALVAVKLFSCSMLYFYSRNTQIQDVDISFAFLLFNFGILAHAVIVMRLRHFEESFLSFYRNMPVSTIHRLIQYAIVYLLLLLPEIVTAFLLVPVHMLPVNAALFLAAAFSMLLLLNSIGFVQQFTIKEFAQVLVVLFFAEYALIITVGLPGLVLAGSTLAILLFVRNCHRFES